MATLWRFRRACTPMPWLCPPRKLSCIGALSPMLVSRPPSQRQVLNCPIQPPQRHFTPEELALYDGTDKSRPIYVSFHADPGFV